MEDTILEIKDVVDNLEYLLPEIEEVSAEIIKRLENGGKIFWMGNGASAADAAHLSSKLVGCFKGNPLPSMALTLDTASVTAIANDYEYNEIFSRQIQAFCCEKDIAIGLSTSGNSLSVVEGLLKAHACGAYTIGLVGLEGGKIAKNGAFAFDKVININSEVTERIQEGHLIVGHLIYKKIVDHFTEKRFLMSSQDPL